MSNDTMQTVIAGIALLISIFSAIYTYMETKKNRQIGYANIESTIANDIRATENRVADLSVEINEYKETENISDKVLESKTLRYSQAIESMLNAYEESCTKYLDNKIDKIRFKKSYSTSITQLVEQEDLKKYFDGVQSRYKGILKVYKEWHDLEK